MLFVIDGYNFIHAVPPFIERDQPILELLELLSVYTENTKGKYCLVVFDGNPPPYFFKSIGKQTKELKWDFSGSEQSADEYIRDFFENIATRNECCLVTNDKGLRTVVASFPTSYASCEQFYSRITNALGDQIDGDEKSSKDSYTIEQWLSLFQKR
jgi:predicted RNA-binding protein with PIN domain